MTRRQWWISGALGAFAVCGGGLWAYQLGMPKTAAGCTSCDARHQNRADRQGAIAKTTSGAQTPPSATVPAE